MEYITSSDTRTVRTTSGDVEFLLTGLMGHTEYKIRVLAVTNRGQIKGEYSQPVTRRTNFGGESTLNYSQSACVCQFISVCV